MKPRRQRAERPYTETRLRDLALWYLGRFSASEDRVRRYLERKVSERGWSESEPAGPAIDRIVEWLTGHTYLDDSAYAEMRARSMARRGLGLRRISQDLAASGIDAEVLSAATTEIDPFDAAVELARRRRFGPFRRAGTPPADRAALQKQLAAMARSGHDLGLARAVLMADDEEALDRLREERA